MSITSDQDTGLATLQDDIVAIKHDISSLIEHLKTSAANSAQSAAARIDEGSRRYYRTATMEGGNAAKQIGRRIEREPLIALLIVLGVGYIGGRLLSR